MQTPGARKFLTPSALHTRWRKYDTLARSFFFFFFCQAASRRHKAPIFLFSSSLSLFYFALSLFVAALHIQIWNIVFNQRLKKEWEREGTSSKNNLSLPFDSGVKERESGVGMEMRLFSACHSWPLSLSELCSRKVVCVCVWGWEEGETAPWRTSTACFVLIT